MRSILVCILFWVVAFSSTCYAQFKPSEQQYLDKSNLSINGGFEQGKRSWTNAVGVFTVDSSEYVIGKKSGKIALTAQTLDFSQTLTTGYNTSLNTLQGVVSAYVKTNIETQLCALVDSVEISCRPISPDNKWGWYEIPVVLGSTSLGIKFKTLSSQTGSIYIDGATYGHGEIVQSVAQAEFIGSFTFEDPDCIFDRTSLTYGVPLSATTNCSASNIKGDVSYPTTNQPTIRINNAIAGVEYKVEYQGLLYNLSNAGGCRFSLSSSSAFENQGAAYIASGNTSRGFNQVTGSFSFISGGAKDISIITLNDAGNTCRVYGETGLEGKFIVTSNPAPETIVRQNQILNDDSTNEFNFIATYSAGWSVTSSDLNPIDNFSVNGTGNWTAVFKAGLFTVAPHVMCKTNSTSGNVTQTLSKNVTTGQFEMQGYTWNGGGFANSPVACSVKKMGVDFNKSLMIYGQFEQINTTPIAYVYAINNGNGSIVADTTNIDFTEVTDDNGLWNGSIFTPTQSGNYSFNGILYSDATHAGTMYVYDITGVALLQFLATNNITASVKSFSGKLPLVAGNQYSLRSSAGFSLNNIDRHYLSIEQSPTTQSIVKNLNDDNNVKCQTKFLSANQSTNGIIADLTFNNLVIGKKYEINSHFFTQETSTSINLKEWAIQLKHDGITRGTSLLRVEGQAFYRETKELSRKITASATVIEFNQLYSNNIMTVAGADTSFVELCQLPSNYTETTEF